MVLLSTLSHPLHLVALRKGWRRGHLLRRTILLHRVCPSLSWHNACPKNTIIFHEMGNGRQAQFCKQECFWYDAVQLKRVHGYLRDLARLSNVPKIRVMPSICQQIYVEFSSDPVAMDTVYRKQNQPEFVVHHRDQSVLTNLNTQEMANVICMRLRPCLFHPRRYFQCGLISFWLLYACPWS